MAPELALFDGLKIKKLTRFSDERGDFREIVRSTDEHFQGFQQLSTSVVFAGIAKAWHLHWDQTESMTVLLGIAKFAFADRRDTSKTFGEVRDFVIDARVNPVLFTMAPGIAHGYRIIEGPAVICYVANRIYDPKDQFKIPHDDSAIGYNWGPPPTV
jgi:dTDP-4-dehydrorhamnose 3,5-epimerase